MILAQKLDSGELRYITVSIYQSDIFIHRLKTFYPNEKRVTALLDLGCLYSLGSSPYGKSTDDYNDTVHCEAHIRDLRGARGKNAPKYITTEKLMEKESHIFLFKDGKWHYYNRDKKYFRGDDFTSELPVTVPVAMSNPLEGLQYTTFNKINELSSIYSNSISSWSELESQSAESGKPIFVFRGNKLVTTINHPLNS